MLGWVLVLEQPLFRALYDAGWLDERLQLTEAGRQELEWNAYVDILRRGARAS